MYVFALAVSFGYVRVHVCFLNGMSLCVGICEFKAMCRHAFVSCAFTYGREQSGEQKQRDRMTVCVCDVICYSCCGDLPSFWGQNPSPYYVHILSLCQESLLFFCPRTP